MMLVIVKFYDQIVNFCLQNTIWTWLCKLFFPLRQFFCWLLLLIRASSSHSLRCNMCETILVRISYNLIRHMKVVLLLKNMPLLNLITRVSSNKWKVKRTHIISSKASIPWTLLCKLPLLAKNKIRH